jgi:hypothetical protein
VVGDTAGEVKEYVNALHVADEAIGTLIEYFRCDRLTIIAIVGDHVAPFHGGSRVSTAFGTEPGRAGAPHPPRHWSCGRTSGFGGRDELSSTDFPRCCCGT